MGARQVIPVWVQVMAFLDEGPGTLNDLARTTDVHNGNIHSAADLLERDGFIRTWVEVGSIETSRSGRPHKRTHALRCAEMTPKGRETFAEVMRQYRAFLDGE